MPKILYFSRDYGYYTTTFIRNEVEYFAQRHNCLYLAQRNYAGNASPSFLRIIPYRLSLLRKLIHKAGWRLNFQSAAYARRVAALVDEFQPDIIHCHFGWEAFMLLDNIDYTKHRIIIHFHGYDASQSLRNPAYVERLRVLIKRPNIFPVVCNPFFARTLAEKLSAPESRFFILPYGIDTTQFVRDQHIERSGKLFVQVSSLVVKKGHEYTLRAFALLPQDCRLVIAGEGARKRKLQRLARKLNIAGRVHFTGALGRAGVIRLLSSADVFVHHSITSSAGDTEGTPTAILEAMAMQLPVVSTRHAGIPEVVEEGVNGFLVAEKDIVDYANRMMQAARMGVLPANRMKIEALYELREHNRKLGELYEVVRGTCI